MQKCSFFVTKISTVSQVIMQLWLGKFELFLLWLAIEQELMLFSNNTNSFRKTVSDLNEWGGIPAAAAWQFCFNICTYDKKNFTLSSFLVQILLVTSCIIHNSFHNFMQIRIPPRKKQFITYNKKYKVIYQGQYIQFQI